MPDTNSEPQALREFLLNIHSQLQLTGEPPNELLLKLPAPLIDYIRSLFSHTDKTAPVLSKTVWDRALQTLSSHGVLPLLYRLMLQASEGGKEIPSGAMERVRLSFQASATRSMIAGKQLRPLLTAIGTAGERCLILKGPALSGYLYPSPAMRPFNDIDILVLPERFTQVRQVIKNLGYRCEAERFDRYRALHCEETFRHPSESTFLPVELHWDIHHLYGFRGPGTSEDFFERAIQKPFEEISFEGLNPIDELIHLTLHMTLVHTRDIRLIWLYDIHLLLKEIHRLKMEEALYQRAREWSASLPLFHALQLTWAWTGHAPPEAFHEAFLLENTTPEQERRWRALVNRHHNLPAMIAYRMPPGLPRLEMVRRLMDLAFPPAENIRKRYRVSHDFLIPFFHIRRFVERFLLRSWKR